MIRIVVFCALGALIVAFICAWLITRIRYRVGSRHVKVLLFGVCIRRFPIASIESVSKRRGTGLAEHWWSTMQPKHRMLVLRRRRGICRNFIITPKNRYVFKTDVERALRRINGDSAAAMSDMEEVESAPEEAPKVQQGPELG